MESESTATYDDSCEENKLKEIENEEKQILAMENKARLQLIIIECEEKKQQLAKRKKEIGISMREKNVVV